MILGARILRRLEAIGISQAELGRRVKLGQSTINGLIKGEQQSTTKLPQIARELQTTPAYLTGETDDPLADGGEVSLTAQERDWLEFLHAAAPKDRAALLQLARTIATGAVSPSVHGKQDAYRGE